MLMKLHPLYQHCSHWGTWAKSTIVVFFSIFMIDVPLSALVVWCFVTSRMRVFIIGGCFSQRQSGNSCVLYQGVVWAKSRCCRPWWLPSQPGLEHGDTHSRAGIPQTHHPMDPFTKFWILSLQAFIKQKFCSEHIRLTGLWQEIMSQQDQWGEEAGGCKGQGAGTQKGIPHMFIGPHLSKLNQSH